MKPAERVKARYPIAGAIMLRRDLWVIRVMGTGPIGRGANEPMAWIDAASRLPAEQPMEETR